MKNLNRFLRQWYDSSERLLVHTSGSTGTPKDIWVEKAKMRASALRTCQFLGLKPRDRALLCLPLDYIAGKMMVVRAMVCHLQLISVPPSSRPLEKLAVKSGENVAIDFTAMVPMQVYASLQDPAQKELLKKIRHLIIGGSGVDTALESQLRNFPGAVWSTYGMTETLSHIAMRRISGEKASSWYEPLDNVNIALTSEHCLRIEAPDVADSPIVTNDIAELDSDGRRFRILGRKDNVICSGAIKIQIEEVEKRLSPVVQGDFAITKCPHPVLGECVVMLTISSNLDEAKTWCERLLPRYWIPKYYFQVSAIPLTPTGKIARKDAADLALREMMKGK